MVDGLAANPDDLPLLEQRPFRSLQISRFAGRLASNSINFALVLLIVDETGRAFMSSLLVVALVVPGTIAGIVAGSAADAFPKRLISFLANVARAAICVYFVVRGGEVPSYFVIAVALASFTQFVGAAEGAILPAIVRRDQLANANAIAHAVGGSAQLIGFAILTPLALRVFESTDTLFLLAALLYLVASVYAVAIGKVRSARAVEVGGAVEESGRWWLVGWRELHREPATWHAATELTLISAAVIILGGLIPSYIQDVLDVPVEIGAILLTPAAIGVALGLRVAGILAHRVPHAMLSTVGFISFVVLLAGVTFADQVAEFLSGYGWFEWLDSVQIGNFDAGGVVAMLLVLPLGFAYALVSVAAQTVINDTVPLHLQGRAAATQNAMAAIASSLPVLVAGALSDAIGVVPVMAMLTALTGVVALANMRHPRKGEPLPQPGAVGTVR